MDCCITSCFKPSHLEKPQRNKNSPRNAVGIRSRADLGRGQTGWAPQACFRGIRPEHVHTDLALGLLLLWFMGAQQVEWLFSMKQFFFFFRWVRVTPSWILQHDNIWQVFLEQTLLLKKKQYPVLLLIWRCKLREMFLLVFLYRKPLGPKITCCVVGHHAVLQPLND